MEKARNWIFLGLLVLLFVEVLIIFPSHLGRKDETVPVAPEGPIGKSGGPTEQKMEGVHLVESQKGARDWEFFSEEAIGNQEKGDWNLKHVKVLFYSKEKVEFTVVGDEGDINQNTKDMRIRGHVVTTSVNGYIFRSEDVQYDAKSRTITSPSAVEMRGPSDQDGEGMLLTGSAMKVDVETSHMIIPGDVHASRELRGKKHMKVTSTSAEFSGESKEAHFSGNVAMEYDHIQLEGPEATFVQTKEGNSMSDIRFSGGVKVTSDDKFATSENLDLDLHANRITFTGKPKVYQGKDELSGEQIVFLDGGKKVKVEKVRAKMEKKSE